MADVGQWDGVCDCYATLVLLLEDDVRRLLVDPNAKAFELVLNDFFVSKRLVHIEDDEN